MTQRPPTPAKKPGRAPAKKKIWQPPQVKTGRLFESNSFACNKLPSESMCQDNPPVTTS